MAQDDPIRVFRNFEQVRECVGTTVGVSTWWLIDQERIDTFAAATGDQQWIHTDPVRAADGPFGRTIAHGWLLVSMLPTYWKDIYRYEGFAMTVNYGAEKIRFPASVPVGSRIQAHVEFVSLQDVPGGARLRIRTTVMVEGGEKPVLVAETFTFIVQ